MASPFKKRDGRQFGILNYEQLPFAGFLYWHQEVEISWAQAALEVLDNALHLSGGFMGAGNIEWLASTPVLEMRRAGRALHIAEDRARHGIIHMRAESQIVRVSHAALYQLPEAGGMHRLQVLGPRPMAQALGVPISCHNVKEGILDPQAEHVQQECAHSDAPIRQRATENQVAEPQFEQFGRDKRLMNRGIGGYRYL
jgi:hypothetical protein